MKEKSHKSRSHSRKDDDSVHSSNKYTSVLKEKYYKDISDSKEEISRSQKSKFRTKDLPNRGYPRSPDRLPSRKGDDRRKNPQANDESYEELSRKKRRIESELQALDLEEAQASGTAESRKPEKHKSDRERFKHKVVKVKQEPMSDDCDTRPPREMTRPPREAEDGDRRKQNVNKEGGAWGDVKEETKKVEKEKEKPNFSVSGKLAEDTNTYNGVVIKYNEPSEARKPRRRWRLYPFKGDSDLPFIPIHRQSAYLFGRTRSIADIPIDHPSCSKQHAVLQFRLVPYKREDGTNGRRVRPYIIDLESSNGTFINNKQVDPRHYVELVEKDVVKFGYSSREYVLLHEESKNDEEDDDVRDSN